MGKRKRDKSTEYPDFRDLRKLTSYLESHSMNDIELEDAGLKRLTTWDVDELFDLAASSFGQDDNYKPRSEIHLRLMKTLLQNGADISSMWQPRDNGCHESLFARMFRRNEETPLDDIEFLIKEKHVLSNLLRDDLGACFSLTFEKENIPLLRVLINNGAIMPIDWVYHELDQIFKWGDEEAMEKVGQILDLLVERKTTVDLKEITPLYGITPEVPTTVLQWPISDYLKRCREALEDMRDYEKDWDLFLGKGHLAPPPEAFTSALSKNAPTFVFAAVYLCLSRGVELKFPDLKLEDKSEFSWDDRTKKVAGLLEEMLYRSGTVCSRSFLVTLNEASGADGKFPSLRNICVAAVRKSWLVPDESERFPDSLRLLWDIPVKPRLIIPVGVMNMIPPAVCDVILLKDLRKDIVGVIESEDSDMEGE